MIYTTQRRRFVYDTWDNGSRLDRVMVESTLSITHCLRLNLQLHTSDLVRTCRISSFCTVAWQLVRFQLTRRIAWCLGDSWASCFYSSYTPPLPLSYFISSTFHTLSSFLWLLQQPPHVSLFPCSFCHSTHVLSRFHHYTFHLLPVIIYTGAFPFHAKQFIINTERINTDFCVIL